MSLLPSSKVILDALIDTTPIFIRALMGFPVALLVFSIAHRLLLYLSIDKDSDEDTNEDVKLYDFETERKQLKKDYDFYYDMSRFTRKK